MGVRASRATRSPGAEVGALNEAPLHLFLELFTVASFLACAIASMRTRGALGAWLYVTVTLLGAVRENFVIFERWLYGFADLSLMLGRAPVVSAVIWAFSIDAGVAFAERVTGEPLAPGRLSARFHAAVALFLIALAGFYEPFLRIVDMARWEPGTARVLDIPKIALIGYPTLAVAFLALWSWVLGRWSSLRARLIAFALVLPALAWTHAWGLVRLKRWLGW